MGVLGMVWMHNWCRKEYKPQCMPLRASIKGDGPLWRGISCFAKLENDLCVCPQNANPVGDYTINTCHYCSFRGPQIEN